MEFKFKSLSCWGESVRLAALLVLILAHGTPSLAADFSFATVIRAGQPNANGWELSAGSNTTNVTPYWSNNAPYRFEIGYTQSGNTAFVRLYNGNVVTQATYQPVGGTATVPSHIWTLPAGSFSVVAGRNPRNTSITVSGLTLTAGSVIQPLATTSLTASQSGNGGPVTLSMPSPVVFTANANGDWMLGGTIVLAGFGNGGASRDDLRFDLTAQASDVPEPSTVTMASLGLLLIFVAAIRKSNRPASTRRSITPSRPV